jgi:UPF0755 protein
MKVLNRLILLVFLVFFIFLGYKVVEKFLSLKSIPDDGYVLLVKKNQTLKSISFKLSNEKIFNNKFTSFLLFRTLIGNDGINAGEYFINKNDNLLDLALKIKNKQYYYRKIVFIEGNLLSTYIEQIKNAEGIVFDDFKKIDEGYFMPGTYLYLYGEKTSNLINKINKEMLNFVSTEFNKINNKESFYLKNIHEVITLASIVEKETGIPSERPLIAGVFYNRLQKNMRLQSDPTAVYEITKGSSDLNRNLTYKDLQVVGKYNTYRISGLPVGPIASPSKSAILAVLNPKKTDYIFFVANGLGGHTFAVDFKTHKENVKRYRELSKLK